MGTALKAGAKTYFAAALFPFGTLLVIADVASDKAMQVKLDPVLFEKATAKLSEERHAYLDKVANVLDEKPEISMKICGVSTSSDRLVYVEQQRQQFEKAQAELQAKQDKNQKKNDKEKQQAEDQPKFVADETLIKTQLETLASQRAEAVSAYFSEQKKVKQARLIDCQPRLETEDADAKPRTDLHL